MKSQAKVQPHHAWLPLLAVAKTIGNYAGPSHWMQLSMSKNKLIAHKETIVVSKKKQMV